MQTYLFDPLTDNNKGGMHFIVHRVRYTPNWPKINRFYTSRTLQHQILYSLSECQVDRLRGLLYGSVSKSD